MGRPGQATLTTGPTAPGTGIAVSPHYLASRAGIDILSAGGTAVDAAIAVDAVLAVVAPDTCGPGGDLFALVHEPSMSEPAALNASGRAGSGTTADELRDKGFGAIPYRSAWSITVPGCVDGWEALSLRYGTLPLSSVLAPAITIARDGFEVSSELASSLLRIEDMVRAEGSAHALYPKEVAPPVGSSLRRPALADVLEGIGDGGRNPFYLGSVGQAISDASLGAISKGDLERNQADWITPASLNVFGRTAWTIPPNSQGYVTLATLWIFSHLDPPNEPNDPLFQHLLIEAYRSVAWERADTVSDSRTAPLTPEELLDPERLALRAERIRPDTSVRWPMPIPALGGTAYMTVLDGSGMGVSFIQSNFAGIGSGRSAGATGVWLHNRGAGFNLIPGHPNEYAPRKRPLHTLSPTLWTRDGELDLLLGTRGGDQQPQYLAQFAATHFLAAMCTDDTQAVPRWSMQQPEPGTDSSVEVESRFADVTINGLRELGHEVTVASNYEQGWGPISAIDVADERKGSADPRISTSAAAVSRSAL
jgi:gamma-glutamyltranspeptidase/glutathione hydrolase